MKAPFLRKLLCAFVLTSLISSAQLFNKKNKPSDNTQQKRKWNFFTRETKVPPSTPSPPRTKPPKVVSISATPQKPTTPFDWRTVPNCSELLNKEANKSVIFPPKDSKKCLQDMIARDPVLKTRKIPSGIVNCLQIIRVPYKKSRDEIRYGELIVNKDLSQLFQNVFERLLKVDAAEFQINTISPMGLFGWQDSISMAPANNNTSVWNYRYSGSGSRLSWHAVGRAIDFNPFQNPYIRRGVADPPGARYTPNTPRSVRSDNVLKIFYEEAKKFTSINVKWGGAWRSPDYQHIELLPDGKSSTSAPNINSACKNPTL